MASMNALVLHEPGKLSLETVPKPSAAPGSVIVKVLAAPMWDYVVRSLPIVRTQSLVSHANGIGPFMLA